MVARSQVSLLYWWRHGRWPNLFRPQRFTQWVQWRKLNDRDGVLARLTDKSHDKRIAAATLGDRFITPTLWAGLSLPRTAPWPMPFVVKADHGCRQTLIIRNAADYGNARRASAGWLKRPYGGCLGEWHYRDARRLILVQPFIGEGDKLPVDFKVYVFGGRAMMIQVHEGRGQRHCWSQHDRNWHCLSRATTAGAALRGLATMLAAAEALGKGQTFVRVDFYEVDGAPLFGELGLYPGSGPDRFDPVALDDGPGAHWTVERQRDGATGSAHFMRIGLVPQPSLRTAHAYILGSINENGRPPEGDRPLLISPKRN